MTMGFYKRRTLRRVAIIRELASLDRTNAEVARLTGLTRTGVGLIAKREGIRFRQAYGGEETPFQRAVREGYNAGKTARQIAAEIGSTENSVLVCASKLGVTIRDPWRFRRGFTIPADRRDEYRELTVRLRCTAQEAGMSMGLIPRGQP